MEKSHKIDWINVGLIPLCLLLAYLMPFKLFLWAYALLGPLHYLTEINWLHNKNFFAKTPRKGFWIFIVAGLLISLPHVFMLEGLREWFLQTGTFYEVIIAFNTHTNALIVWLLLVSLGTMVVDSIKQLFIIGLIALLPIIALNQFEDFSLWAGIFLPTLVHVYLFTGLFMAYGSLKSGSSPGWISVILLAIVPFIIILLPEATPLLTEDFQGYFAQTGFQSITYETGKLVSGDLGKVHIFESPVMVKAQTFIAFAYLYHYLNWFTKTGIIGWHKSLNKKSTIVVLSLYFISIGLYLWDYVTGLKLLFFLSMLHVFLEFPLNWLSIKGILKIR